MGARYYPDPSSILPVTPPWHRAPDGGKVTILFSFIGNWKEIKESLIEEENAHVLDCALHQHDLLVRLSPAGHASVSF
jgi:hypothetical protein